MKKLVITLCVILMGCQNAENKKPDEYGAYFKCQDGVKQQLKAPASAVFPSISDTQITTLRVGRRGGKDEIQFLVAGYVDAQNGFGANLRNSFTCKTTGQTGNYWRLDNISIL